MQALRFAHANDLGALDPETWVAEGIRVLRKELRILPNISTNYSAAVARMGQLVHVHKRQDLTADRKLPGVDVVAQDLIMTEELIRLNQQPYVHYRVDDVEQSTSMGDVVNDFIEPGFYGIAEFVETCNALQAYDFFRNQAGGDLTNGVGYNDLVDARAVLNALKIPLNERLLYVNNTTESQLLKENKLTSADAIGGDQRLLNGIVGSGAGFGIIPSLAMPVAGADALKIKATGAVNLSAGYAKGTTTLVVDGFTGLLTVGSFVKIEDVLNSNKVGVHQITAQTASSGNTVGITIVPGLVRNTSDNARVIVYTPGTVNTSKAAQFAGAVRVTMPTGTVPDQYGGISFAADGAVYGILRVASLGSDEYDLKLNRPLDAAITATGVAALFPPVSINWSCTKDAITMVGRSLRLPKGATSAANGAVLGISLRVVVGYNQLSQEEMVTIDTLFGVQTLDRNKGCLIIG